MKGMRLYPGTDIYPHRPAALRARRMEAARATTAIAASDAPDVVKAAQLAAYLVAERRWNRICAVHQAKTSRKERAELRFRQAYAQWRKSAARMR